jgi:hypothetical protein
LQAVDSLKLDTRSVTIVTLATCLPTERFTADEIENGTRCANSMVAMIEI